MVLDLDNLTDVRLPSSSNPVQHQVAHRTTPEIWFREAGKQDDALVPSGNSRLSGTIGRSGNIAWNVALASRRFSRDERQTHFSSPSCLAIEPTTRTFRTSLAAIFVRIVVMKTGGSHELNCHLTPSSLELRLILLHHGSNCRVAVAGRMNSRSVLVLIVIRSMDHFLIHCALQPHS